MNKARFLEEGAIDTFTTRYSHDLASFIKSQLPTPPENLHTLDAAQLRRLNDDLTERTKPSTLAWLESLALSFDEEEVWLDCDPVLRFFIPWNLYKNHAKTLHKPGYLTLQDPHYDTWFGHAKSGINAWLAVGPVREGNSLCLFTDMWGKDQIKNLKDHPPFGKPYVPVLSPGEYVVFGGEHLHSSELNITNETRVVVTGRWSFEQPEFTTGGNSSWKRLK